MRPVSRISVPLRTALTLAVIVTTVSFGAFAAWVLVSMWERQRTVVERQNLEFARAVSVAIDQTVEKAVTALSVLASLDALDDDDLREFRELARRRVPRQEGWHAVLLASPSAQVLFNTAAHFVDAPSQLPSDWARAVIASGKPEVSNLAADPGVPGHFFIVAVPVVRQGSLRYVLAAKLRREVLSDVLHQQHVPPNGVVTLLDRNVRVMARTRGEQEFVGGPPSPGFQNAVARMHEGSWRETLLEGMHAYASLSRSSVTGWTVGVGVPTEEIDGPIRRDLRFLGSLGIALLALGCLASMMFARSIVPALTDASGAASALARGDAMVEHPSRIAEIQDLFAGLRRAEQILATRERERDAALRAEQEAREEAERANRVKDEFLMTVSHELRTPLTAITGWARMLHNGDVRPEQRARAVETIDRNARSLMVLVDDLIDVARFASGKLRLDIRPVDIVSVVEAVIASVQPAAAAKRIDLRTSYDPDAGAALVDEGRLQQIVWNLVMNAVKFTPAGGHVDVSVWRRSSAIEFVVSDSGPGISAELMPFVFDPFRQGNAGTSRDGGLGLGLAIVRHLVEAHGGMVHATNNASGAGATLIVSLPVATASESPNFPIAPVSAL
jgi:signal transduction histidine kinase